MGQKLKLPEVDQNPDLKKCVSWFRGTEVQRLLMNKKSIRGVECWCKTQQSFMEIHARKEVILCAGAIETPALLLVSGLDSSLHGIGCHLKDQVLISRALFQGFRKTSKLSINGIAAIGHLKVEKQVFQVAIADGAGYFSILPTILAMPFRRARRTRSSPARIWETGSRLSKVNKNVILDIEARLSENEYKFI